MSSETDKKAEYMAYRNDYRSGHYDRIEILAPAGSKAKVKALAATANETVTAYILRLVHEDEARRNV